MLVKTEILRSIDSFTVKEINNEKYLSLIKNIVVFENQCLFLIDLEEYQVVYFRGRCIDDEKINIKLNYLFDKILPSDKSEVLHQLRQFWNFLKSNPAQISLEHEITLNYRIRNGQPKPIPIMHQSTLLVDQNNNRFILNIWSLLELLDHNTPIRWTITGPGLNNQQRKSVSRPRSLFTEREMEILQLLHKRFSSIEISERLFISRNTVDTHRRKILKKAGVGNTSDLIMWAIKNGLVEG